MIDLQHLSIGYKSPGKTVTVFSGLELSFPKGQLIGLIGNNGVGKSTLIKTLCGYLPPLEGEIQIEGQHANRYTVAQLARFISIVLPEKITGFNLTAYDVVASGRTPYINAFSQLSPNDKAIIRESIEAIGISHLQHTLMEELSDGQRQKVMIAKSLAQQTPVIILDEPTAFLDYSSKHQLFDILKQLCYLQNILVIVSSHDLELLFAHANKVLLMEPGNGFMFDESSEVRRKLKI